jgi:hypothetical protein
VQRLEVLDGLLGRDQLGGEGLRGLLVLLRLRLVARGTGLVGEHERLPGRRLQLLDLSELPVELHLQLTLVADHRGRLLGQRLMLPLSVLDGLLDLHLGVGVLVDLGREQRHQVLPGLRETVGHLLRPPSATPLVAACRCPGRPACPPVRRFPSWHRTGPASTARRRYRGSSGGRRRGDPEVRLPLGRSAR